MSIPVPEKINTLISHNPFHGADIHANTIVRALLLLYSNSIFSPYWWMQGAELIEENKILKQKVGHSRSVFIILPYIFYCRHLEKGIGWSISVMFQMTMLTKGKRHVVVEPDVAVPEEGVSSESATNVCSCNSGPPLEDDGSDTSLKLGYNATLLHLDDIT